MNSSGGTEFNAQRPQLPADKHDVESVCRLENLDVASLGPLIPELLTWLQDMNWPVAGPVLQLMLKNLPLVTVPVASILRGEDDIWKSNCLEYLVNDMPHGQQKELTLELERLAIYPTASEMEEDAHLTAKAILDRLQDLGCGKWTDGPDHQQDEKSN
jgi:hypothetical protein